MTQNLLKTIILPIAVIIASYGVLITLSGPLERAKPQLPEGYEDTELSFKGSNFKGFLIGTEGLVADWNWMRALQYVGDKLENSKLETINLEDLRALNIKLLYPYLDNATDLDPHFLGAYSYGAIVLPAIDPRQAIAIAEKGIANNPQEWRLYQYLGYIYWRLKIYDKASEAYERGSLIEGSPSFMRLMAASLKKDGSSRGNARTIYRQMLLGDDPSVKPTAQLRLKELDALDELDAINAVFTAFKEKNGRCVSSFNEVGETILQIKLPEDRTLTIDKTSRLVDPTGAPYLLDKETCRAKLDPEQTKLPQS